MKKTIILYIGTLGLGGAEHVMAQLANGLSSMNYRVILITTYRAVAEYSIERGVERIVLGSKNTVRNRILKNIKYTAKIREICRNNKASLIISFTREPNVRAMFATFGTKTQNIISVRVDPSKEYPGFIGKLTCEFLLSMADGCVFQTEDAKKYFPAKLRKKSKVILNPVAKEFFAARKGNAHNIVTVCRLERQKNVGLLIRAFAKIEEKYPAEKLLIYGEGSSRYELEKMITSLQLDGRVILKGRSTNIPEVLSEAKIFALASDFEGLPNALMEALAVGIPSIATDCPCGGPRVLIEDGVNGRLVPVGDENKMAEALDMLLADSKYAARLGSEAAVRAAEQFRSDVVIDQWREMIERIADGDRTIE